MFRRSLVTSNEAVADEPLMLFTEWKCALPKHYARSKQNIQNDETYAAAPMTHAIPTARACAQTYTDGAVRVSLGMISKRNRRHAGRRVTDQTPRAYGTEKIHPLKPTQTRAAPSMRSRNRT